MKKRAPLTYEEAMTEISKLRPFLLAVLTFRDALATETIEEYQLAAHKFHVQGIRYGCEIADIVGRYKLDCPVCIKKHGDGIGPKILGDWFLVSDEKFLKCPTAECAYYKPIRLFESYKEIETLIAFAPVPVQDLFTSER